ncbi:MAG: hypothetical protein ABL983_02785 [Nitrospira sp.]
MSSQPGTKKRVRVTAEIPEDVAKLLEAWCSQNYIGKQSRSKGIWAILAIYLGAETWNCGPPGHGVAWDQSCGWKLKDSRTHLAQRPASAKLRLTQDGDYDLEPLETRLSAIEEGLGVGPQPSGPRLRLV